MFALRSLYNYLFETPPTKECYVQDYNRIIAEINEFGADEDGGDNNRHVEESYMPDAEFVTYRGIVTDLYNDGSGRIDTNYQFNTEAASHLPTIRVGARVSCLARKISKDLTLIYKVNSVDDDDDDDTWMANDQVDFDDIRPGNFVAMETHQRSLKGEIVGKMNGEIGVKVYHQETELAVKLLITEIGCTFNPTAGDIIDLDVECGVDPNNPNVPTLVGYYGLKANDYDVILGRITTFKKKLEYGLIDEKYIFFLDVLQHSNNQNWMPNKGDMVSADVISSHQKIDDREFFWRCTNIVKTRGQKTQNDAAILECHDNGDDAASDDEIDDATCGLTMTPNAKLKAQLDEIISKKRLKMIVDNKSDRPHRIGEATFSNEIIASQIECNQLYRPHTIQAGGRVVYDITVIGKMRGLFKLKMDFIIDNKHVMRRCITIDVKSVEESSRSARVSHSKAYTKKVYTQRGETIKGIRPVDSPHFIDIRLDRFEVPPSMFEQSITCSENHEIDEKYAKLFSSLSVKNYGDFFHHLLYFEEIHMRHEFRMYDQDRGHFHFAGEYLAYEMDKNVFECRPSIIIGDTIEAHSLIQTTDKASNDSTSNYQGFIHRIDRKRLLLKFAPDFHAIYRGEDYKLIFNFSRSKYIKQHNAIERIAKKMKGNGFAFLFPTSIKSAKQLQLEVQYINGQMILDFPRLTLKWFNKNLNDIQRQAVFNVLRGEVKMCPYIVFGPPGTGKTSTLIEIILQLYRKGNTRIIVAAPSNSAANLLTKYLAESGALKTGQFVRIAGQNSLEREQIPDELREHCITVDIATPRSRLAPENPIENGVRVQCNSSHISKHRILISTCMTFGSLLYMKFEPDHFTHAVIDEAGQCTEPEIAIPISLINKDDGQIILAGDPQQLGPVVLSPQAKRCGLDKSLLSRLLDHLPYRPDVGRNGGFDERMVTQLLHNYRSLPSILNEYSMMSYSSKLIPNISDEDSKEAQLLANVQANIHPSCKLNHTPNHGVYFVGIRGKDHSPADSTSWQNEEEAFEVTSTINQLYKCGLTEDDIGVVTPYTLQVKYIRSMCDGFDINQPKIGSVEEFQGQERNVIILSTVRSTNKEVSHDERYGLGFVSNKKRLNVAISRARAILIIFGNPYILCKDENWRQLIYNCYMNKTYSGVTIPQTILNEME